jgi:hypothetical protein
MKAKRKISSLLIVMSLSLFIVSCGKKPNVEPVPDKEFKSSIDASYAAMIATDIDMICAYVGENNLVPKFYYHQPQLAGTAYSVTVSNDNSVDGRNLFIVFNNTKCLDGRMRDGTIKMNYKSANPNAVYYRSFEFVGNVSLIGYKVDGWSVELRNSFFIKNLLPSPSYSSAKTNLSWSLGGDFDLKHPNDPTKNIHANINLTKTLANTSSPIVFAPSQAAAINWSLAVVEYKGTMFGETAGNVPFKYEINNSRPLIRDFTCYPDKISGVAIASNSITSRFEEYHPFLNGAASFTTSTAYPRVIYYGSEDGSAPQCDNTGAVAIKGISYPVNFAKSFE